jgi:hypothetical protein
VNVYYGEDSHGWTVIDDDALSGYDGEAGYYDPEYDETYLPEDVRA